MKNLFLLSSELLSFIAIAFFLGQFLDKKLMLGGWLTIISIVVAYILWFLRFYKKVR